MQFQDGMVVQRDQEVTLSGRAAPQAQVSVYFRDEAQHVRADLDGEWQARVPTGSAGGPFFMQVVSGEDRIELSDILVGEVWLAGGQSNMVFRVSSCSTAGEDLPKADFPDIRFFKTTLVTSARENKEVPGVWRRVSPDTASELSGVGFYFARRLHRELEGVPVGIIQSAWGGSKIEPWIGGDAFREDPGLRVVLDRLNESLSGWEEAAAEYAHNMETWYAAHPGVSRMGRLEEDMRDSLHQPDSNAERWKPVDMPFVKAPILKDHQNGVVWFRREVEITPEMAGKELQVDLGLVDAQRIVYFNGEEISSTSDATPVFWMKPLIARVPARLVKEGRGMIVVRCLFQYAGGNSYHCEHRTLATPDGEVKVDLSKGWSFTAGPILGGNPAAGTHAPRPWPVPRVPWDLGQPASMFNAMIAPLAGFPLRGVIWYQGEANVVDGSMYGILLKALMANWRKRWGDPELAFGIVQLAGYGEQMEGPMESPLAEFRQIQFNVARTVPGCGIVTAIDVGDPEAIHPVNKKPVGERLAGWALSEVYGQDIEWSGPQVRDVQIFGNRLRVTFSHVAEGLHARRDPIRAFDLLDGAGVWHRRSGQINGIDSIELDVSGIGRPLSLRYAWGNTPDCDLENSEGLPAFPFVIEIAD